MRYVVAFVALMVWAGSAAAQEKIVHPAPPELSALPFSEAVQVGNLLFLSGQIGTIPGGTSLAPGGIGPETKQTLENIKATLDKLGSGMDRAVKCTVFLADIGDYAAMNAVYRTFFPRDPPARSTVAGSGLALGARVEIECIALAEKPK